MRIQKKFSEVVRCLVAILICELVGIAGTPFTASALSTWYADLLKPSFSPPSWVFGPVWTMLYFLMGISLYLVWRQGWHKKKVRIALEFFAAQLILNFLWSPVFFGLRSPQLALAVIVLLLALILATLQKFYPLSKPAFYLLVPYLLWVSFATLLNFSIVLLN